MRLDFDLSAHWPRVRMRMGRYERMDLADGSIVVTSEVHVHLQVLTLDRADFSVYRRSDRQTIDVVAPPLTLFHNGGAFEGIGGALAAIVGLGVSSCPRP